MGLLILELTGTVLAETASLTMIIAGVTMFLAVVFVFVAIWMSRYKKVGPDQVLVVSGRQYLVEDKHGKTRKVGFRLVRGGGTFVWPVYETAESLSLKPILVELDLPGVIAQDGHSAAVVASAQIRISPEENSLLKAAENLLGKTNEEVRAIAGQVMESSARGLLGSWTTPELFERRGQLAGLWEEAAKPMLMGLGLELVSLSVRDVKAAQRMPF